MGPAELERFKQLVSRSHVRWPYLLDLAQEHRVTSLFYLHLQRARPAAAPAHVWTSLDRRFHADLAANLALARELGEIVELFRAHGIGVLPFKGAVTALDAYGTVALRSPGDMDLLIYRGDLERAADLLRSRSYTSPEEKDHPDVRRSKPLELQLFKDKFLVELRWRLTSYSHSKPLNLGYLSSRIRPLNLLGIQVPHLPPEELLLVLCIHGSGHHWARLMWICDVAQIVRTYPALDWARVGRHAVRLGVSPAVGTGLLVASLVLDAPVPERILLSYARDGKCRAAAVEASRDVLTGGLAKRTYFYRAFLSKIRLMNHRRDQLRHAKWFLGSAVRKIFPTEADRAALRLPRALSFLYYALRPIRLAVAYGLSSRVRR